MVASTDAVAIVAVMKTSGGPKRLRSILEGESLLNDASGLTLFEIFFHYVQMYAASGGDIGDENVGQIVGHIIWAVGKMGLVGFLLGIAFGIATRILLRFMRRLGASKDQEVALTLAMAYLNFWVVSSPAKGSGVIAVAVMGLYGAATNHWDMSTRTEEEGTFDGFYETLAFTVNSIVFLYSGASCVNFFIRSMDSLEETSRGDMAKTLWMLPIVFIVLNLLRFLLTLAFRPLFKAVRGDINTREAVFVSAAGLRGSVSLIMGQAVVTDRLLAQQIPVVKSEIVFWTAGFVFLTLLINAPLLPAVLRWTKLNAVSMRQLLRRKRALQALAARTAEAVDELREAEDELLSGVDWAQVERFVDHSAALEMFERDPSEKLPRSGGGLYGWWRRRRGGGGSDGGGSVDASVRGGGGKRGGSGGGGGGDTSRRSRGGRPATPMSPNSKEGSTRSGDVGRQPMEVDDAAALFGRPCKVDVEQGGGANGAVPHDSDGDDDGDDEASPRPAFLRRSHTGLLADVLPDLVATPEEDIDVLHQEMPFCTHRRQEERERKLDAQRTATALHRRRSSNSAGGGDSATSPRARTPVGGNSGGAPVVSPRGAHSPPQQVLMQAMGGRRAPEPAPVAPPPGAAAAGGADDRAPAAAAASGARAAAAPAPRGAAPPPQVQRPLRNLSTQSARPTFGRTAHDVGAAAAGTAVGSPPPAQQQPQQQPLPVLARSSSGHPRAALSYEERALGRPSAPYNKARSLATRSFGLYPERGGGEAGVASLGGGGGGGARSGGEDSSTGSGSRGGAGGGGLERPSRRLTSIATLHSHAPQIAPRMPALAKMSNVGGAGAGMPGGGGGGGGGGSGRSLAACSVPVSLHGMVSGAPHLRSAYRVRGGGGAGGGSDGDGDASLPAIRASFEDVDGAAAGVGAKGVGGLAAPSVTSATSSSGWLAAARSGSGGSFPVLGRETCSEEALEDARSWLAAGLKRYFHAKRMEGLLSARGLRILDFSCDTLLEEPSGPFALWSIIRRDVTSSFVIRFATTGLFIVRRAAVAIMRPGLGAFGRALAAPLRMLAGVLQRPLNKVLLLSVEVAMEYLMGLTSSPYVTWLQESGDEAWVAALLEEVREEASAVWQFLIDREIEAPERYSAIQSYRAAMAILRQQRKFVENLFESGMIDDVERDIVSRPIDLQERSLELAGPCWRAPGVSALVSQLPFMRGRSTAVQDFFMRYGALAMYTRGSNVAPGRDLVMVQSGIVKVLFKPESGPSQEIFVGAGGLYNLYVALTGEKLPGVSTAVAQGNTLGKGPVLFRFSAAGLEIMRKLAAGGNPEFQQMELDMFRLAAIFLLERLRPQVEADLAAMMRLAAPPQPPQKAPAGGDGGAAAGDGGAGAAAAVAARAQRALWVKARTAALRSAIKVLTASAELLEVPPGLMMLQNSTIILMRGSLEVSAQLAAPSGSAPASAASAQSQALRSLCLVGKHEGCSILPWLWDLLSPEELEGALEVVPRSPPQVTLTAGPRGATLLLCGPTYDPHDVAAVAATLGASELGRTPSMARLPAAAAAAGALPASGAHAPSAAEMMLAPPGLAAAASANPWLRKSFRAPGITPGAEPSGATAPVGRAHSLLDLFAPPPTSGGGGGAAQAAPPEARGTSAQQPAGTGGAQAAATTAAAPTGGGDSGGSAGAPERGAAPVPALAEANSFRRSSMVPLAVDRGTLNERMAGFKG